MSPRLFLSSGDLIADRRYDFARDLQLRGDLAAAADVMEQAVEIAPNFASAWFALGELRRQLKERDAAIAAYRRARDVDPVDRHGASLCLMLLGAEQLSAMPPQYVRALFDQYAPKFDKTLIKDLDYCGPEVLLKAVLTTCHSLKQPAHFKRALDLGCGTGLAAREFASLADTFFGVDLSPGMIELARATALYERLDVADMVAGMREHADASINLVLAADSVVYLADLAPLLQEVMRVLASQCVVAFTVETHAGEGVILGKGLRYAHAAAYVSAAVERAGLKRQAITPVSTRTEAGDPVPGLVVTAVKT